MLNVGFSEYVIEHKRPVVKQHMAYFTGNILQLFPKLSKFFTFIVASETGCT